MILDNKIVQAYQDNHIDLRAAKDEGNIEDINYCKGFEDALEFVLNLFGFDMEEVRQRPINKRG